MATLSGARACTSDTDGYNTTIMTEHLRYGIEMTDMNNRLFLDIPVTLVARIQKANVTVDKELRSLSAKQSRIIDLEPSRETVRLFINTKKIGTKREDQARRIAAHRAAALISWVDLLADTNEKDPDLTVEMPTTYTSDGRLPMRAEVKWPARSSDEKMGQAATYFMRDTAYKLNYERKMIDELVYGQVVRERGVILETNPLGSCNIGAGGSMYFPEQPTVELYQHNLYSPIQQLICFAGAVAFSKADQLAVPTA